MKMKRARNSDVSCGASISVLRAKKNSEKLNCFEILFRFIVVAAAVDVPSCCIDMCVCVWYFGCVLCCIQLLSSLLCEITNTIACS